jgi:hypothetical protein
LRHLPHNACSDPDAPRAVEDVHTLISQVDHLFPAIRPFTAGY